MVKLRHLGVVLFLSLASVECHVNPLISICPGEGNFHKKKQHLHNLRCKIRRLQVYPRPHPPSVREAGGGCRVMHGPQLGRARAHLLAADRPAGLGVELEDLQGAEPRGELVYLHVGHRQPHRTGPPHSPLQLTHGPMS